MAGTKVSQTLTHHELRFCPEVMMLFVEAVSSTVSLHELYIDPYAPWSGFGEFCRSSWGKPCSWQVMSTSDMEIRESRAKSVDEFDILSLEAGFMELSCSFLTSVMLCPPVTPRVSMIILFIDSDCCPTSITPSCLRSTEDWFPNVMLWLELSCPWLFL